MHHDGHDAPAEAGSGCLFAAFPQIKIGLLSYLVGGRELEEVNRIEPN